MKKSFLILFVLICCLTDSFAGKNKREEALEEGTSLEQGTGAAKRLRPNEDTPSDKESETSHTEDSYMEELSSSQPPSLEELTPPNSHSEELPQGKENKEGKIKKSPPNGPLTEEQKAEIRKKLIKRTDSQIFYGGRTIRQLKLDSLNQH